MTVLVYNPETNRMERYSTALNNAMPYANSTLKVREFRGNSSSESLWTDRRAMNSWVQFRAIWGQPIYLACAFNRIGEGGHDNQSRHYAGTAFDIAQNLTDAQRAQMRTAAINSGLWSYVKPVSSSPTWVHVDRRTGVHTYPVDYPALRQGAVGVYVCVLQDALEVSGHSYIGIDGYFGLNTDRTVRSFQAQQGLTADGIVGSQTWTKLTNIANGRWRQ